MLFPFSRILCQPSKDDVVVSFMSRHDTGFKLGINAIYEKRAVFVGW